MLLFLLLFSSSPKLCPTESRPVLKSPLIGLTNIFCKVSTFVVLLQHLMRLDHFFIHGFGELTPFSTKKVKRNIWKRSFIKKIIVAAGWPAFFRLKKTKSGRTKISNWCNFGARAKNEKTTNFEY